MAWMKHVLQMSLKRYELSQPRPQGPPCEKLPTKDLSSSGNAEGPGDEVGTSMEDEMAAGGFGSATNYG